MNDTTWPLKYVCEECSRTGWECADHWHWNKEISDMSDTLENIRLELEAEAIDPKEWN